MRIGIDGYNLAIPNGTGVATYGASMANVLRRSGHQIDGLFGIAPARDPAQREVMFFDRLANAHRHHNKALYRQVVTATILNHGVRRPTEVPLTGKVDYRSLGQSFPHFDRLFTCRNLFEEGYARFRYLDRFLSVQVPDPPAVMHWTYPVPVRMEGALNIYTIHDLVPLKLPQATLDDKPYYHRLIERCVTTGDHILTVSDASRADIQQLFDVPNDQVTNAYESSPLPDEIAGASLKDERALVERSFGLEYGEYFLFFGAVDPKKNITRIIDGFLASHSKRDLVMVMARDWGMEQAHPALARSESDGAARSPRIIRLEYLPRAMLFKLVRGARALLFPSLYEGFGLPALEAIQLGTPVLGSNVGSLPEVIGDAGLLVDPYSAGDITAAIRKLDRDDALVKRLTANTAAQAAKFSDRNFAERLHALYQRLGLIASSTPLTMDGAG